MTLIDRRGILKLFGVGATIAPIVAGMPQLDTTAKLIVEPTVELIAPPAVELAAGNLEELFYTPLQCTLLLRDPKRGKSWRMECSHIDCTAIAPYRVDVTSLYQDSDFFPQHMPGLHSTLTLRASGPVRVIES